MKTMSLKIHLFEPILFFLRYHGLWLSGSCIKLQRGRGRERGQGRAEGNRKHHAEGGFHCVGWGKVPPDLGKR